MKKFFFMRSSFTCRMLRVFAAVMLLLPVNLQFARAAGQTPDSKSLLTVKMKDATIQNVFAEIERTSRYAFIYTDDVRPLLDRRVTVSVRSATLDQLLAIVLQGSELTARVRDNQIIVTKKTAPKNNPITPPPTKNRGKRSFCKVRLSLRRIMNPLSVFRFTWKERLSVVPPM